MSETTNSRIKDVLRKLWMWSPERTEAMRSTGYCCNRCGVKQSKAKGKEQKIEVHHKKGEINWDRIIFILREELLCNPEQLEPLCPECHAKETYNAEH